MQKRRERSGKELVDNKKRKEIEVALVNPAAPVAHGEESAG